MTQSWPKFKTTQLKKKKKDDHAIVEESTKTETAQQHQCTVELFGVKINSCHTKMM